jgi:hypothetical protein
VLAFSVVHGLIIVATAKEKSVLDADCKVLKFSLLSNQGWTQYITEQERSKKYFRDRSFFLLYLSYPILSNCVVASLVQNFA